VVLIYGKGIKIYQMTRIPDDTVPEWCEASVYVDDAEIEALAKTTADFWNDYVLTNTPPMADGTKSTSETLKTIYPESNGSSVSLMAFESDLKQYKHLASMEEDYKKLKEECANKIKAYMGEASNGESNSYKVSWASSVRNTFDHKKFAKDNPGIDLSGYYNQTPTRIFKVIEL
jgi:predicted phage-related endonuclease